MQFALPCRWVSVTPTHLNPEDWTLAAIPVEYITGQMAQFREKMLRASRPTAPLHLDGLLDDAAWQQAKAGSGFHAIAGEGVGASQGTDVRVAYDDRYIYLGITTHEREKKGFDTTNGAAGRPWWGRLRRVRHRPGILGPEVPPPDCHPGCGHLPGDCPRRGRRT